MTAVRNGLLLAQKLKRILVLPRFTCFCDRHWTPIMPQCAMANSDLKPPFYCPLDHIFNPVTFFRGGAVQVECSLPTVPGRSALLPNIGKSRRCEQSH
jgi:hypothetical protein